jgi:hypothetical protein
VTLYKLIIKYKIILYKFLKTKYKKCKWKQIMSKKSQRSDKVMLAPNNPE